MTWNESFDSLEERIDHRCIFGQARSRSIRMISVRPAEYPLMSSSHCLFLTASIRSYNTVLEYSGQWTTGSYRRMIKQYSSNTSSRNYWEQVALTPVQLVLVLEFSTTGSSSSKKGMNVSNQRAKCW